MFQGRSQRKTYTLPELILDCLVNRLILIAQNYRKQSINKINISITINIPNIRTFAMGNKPWPAILDGFGNAFGYAWILIVVAFFREFLGSGTIYNYPVMEWLGVYDLGYKNNGLMILSPMALITVGIIIWIQRSRNKELIEEN